MAVVIKDRPSAPSLEFEQLLVDNMDSMFISALRLTQNHADAKDLQQDALVRALRFHHKFEQGTYIKA
ncbi:MAG: RNA polymerase subunit sigma-70, partial [Candidatus Hydrogenedentota bacterium]